MSRYLSIEQRDLQRQDSCILRRNTGHQCMDVGSRTSQNFTFRSLVPPPNWASRRHHQSRNLDRKLFSQTEGLGESQRIAHQRVFSIWNNDQLRTHYAPQINTGNISQNVSANISGLSASTTYHFRIVTTNSAGTIYGATNLYHASPNGFPIVTTKPATNVAIFSATLNGLLDPHGLTTSVHFQYGTTTNYGRTTAVQSQTGNKFRNTAANIVGLASDTLYHFRIVAINSVGTRYGSDRTFTTQ